MKTLIHTKTTRSRSGRKRLSLKKKIFFGLLASGLFSFLALAILELLLHTVDYGHSSKFYRYETDEEGTHWIRENRWVTFPYFPKELVRRPQPFRIPATKGSNTYRIFLLGSSAAMGDPESSFSIARTLDELLSESYPEIEFEIVNAAITAVNSHVVRGIAEDCLELDPDLLIVYEGHNEVIGPFGPSNSTNSLSKPRGLVASLRKSRTGQLVSSLARSLSANARENERWRGMEMYLEKRIAKNDKRLEQVRIQFSDNLSEIALACKNHEVDLFLCTVLSNKRDLAPFQSKTQNEFSSDKAQEFSDLLSNGDQFLAKGDNAKALTIYNKARSIDPSHAGLAFRLGRTHLSLGNAAEASFHLNAALDLDTLRFRTDSSLNDSIRNIASQHDTGIQLVDLEAWAESKTDFQLLGDDWFYEHVHLNFYGTYQVAFHLHRTISESLTRDGRIKSSETEPISISEVRNRLAYTTYEQAMIIHTLLDRFSGAPFTEQLGNPARLDLWRARATAANLRLNRPDALDSMSSIYEYALSHRPHDWILHRNFGMALLSLGKSAKAASHLERATAIIDNDPETLFALATAYKALGKNEESAKTFELVGLLEPQYPGLN